MNIVSYRGPGKAGGVSSGLASLWNDVEEDCSWWYVNDKNLTVAPQHVQKQEKVVGLHNELISGHYRYCNNFLWPVLHDLPEHAIYSVNDRRHYINFNNIVANNIVAGQPGQDLFFVQDYQFALLPLWFNLQDGPQTGVFWHIPWPKKIRWDHAEALEEIAGGLLNAEFLGFHTHEYAHNFMEFVSHHFAVECDLDTMTIRTLRGNRSRASKQNTRRHVVHETQIIVSPLGIDMVSWRQFASGLKDKTVHPRLQDVPFVLSVDRADYTKGVRERLLAIDAFFEKHCEWLGKITFAQICNRSRPGLPEFDDYWHECRALASHLQQRWGMPDWQPLIWLEDAIPPADLAVLYRTAEAMLVNPVRDGLNLTAKEFVACRDYENPGILLLSSGAGSWHELKEGAVEINPVDVQEMADSIQQALSMTAWERRQRLSAMNHALASHTLQDWWQTFSEPSGSVAQKVG